MRYFNTLPQAVQETLFFRRPEDFSKTTERENLRDALGGLLYTPGTSPHIAQMVCSHKIPELAALAVCLEDAVGDAQRSSAMENTMRQFALLQEAVENGSLSAEACPLLFIRVKNAEMLEEMADFLIRASPILTGVILPKVTPESLTKSLALIEEIHRQSKDPFYAMPILESRELMSCGDRLALLHKLRAITDRSFDRILNIRVGATDLCGLYGIRRSVDTPIYQVTAIASCITDVVRVFGLGGRYTLSGPVWEYYRPVSQSLKDGHWTETDGLLREAALDQQNGFCGKTCAHPAQLLPVQASCVVPWETYQDAVAIWQGDQGHTGVLSSVGRNKMNELKPHALWAQRILRRAQFFGVFRKNIGVRNLFRAFYGGVHL